MEKDFNRHSDSKDHWRQVQREAAGGHEPETNDFLWQEMMVYKADTVVDGSLVLSVKDLLILPNQVFGFVLQSRTWGKSMINCRRI